MLGWRGGHNPNAALLKVGCLPHVCPQLPHTGVVEMVPQPPGTLLG